MVLPVASTGIASLLMETGTTAHKMFAIQITNEVNGQPSPNVACSQNLTQRNIIKDADIIIWDEITMTPKSVILAVDKLLSEEKKRNIPFSGCVVVFSGDFRQCLSVVLNNPSMPDVYERSFLCLPYIQDVKFLKLTENMRNMFAVRPEDCAEKQRQAYALLKIGTGVDLFNGKGHVDLSLLGADLTQFFSMSALSQFLTQMYDQNIFQNVNHLGDPVKLDELMRMYASSCVLTPKNVTVNEVNRKVLGRLPTSVEILKSEQVIEGATTQFISQWTPQVNFFIERLPDNELRLKVGCPVILLRNVSAGDGLVNGTRMIITRIHDQNVAKWITCRVLTGKHAGNEVDLPRLLFRHKADSKLPVEFTRKQFPIRVCFAMTIMKSQGQTFSGKVGLFLPADVFSHGQLYVGLSQCTDMKNFKFCFNTRRGRARREVVNMVCPQVTERLVQETNNEENTDASTFASITFDTSVDTTLGSI